MRKADRKAREEAAAWIARLEGGGGAADRDAFARWLAEDPAHREAYDRAAATYAASAMLHKTPTGRRRSLEAAFPARRSRLGAGLVTAGVAGIFLIAGLQLLDGRLAPPLPMQSALLLSSLDESRRIRLEDGSTLTLAPASAVRIEVGYDRRRARLEKGMAEFSIAADGRPFVIEAGRARAVVSEGRLVATLKNGAGTVVRPNPGGEGIIGQPSGSAEWRAGASLNVGVQFLEFRSTPLGDAVRAANSVAHGRRIVIDPALGDLRVTGRFRSGDTAGLAASLAAAFNLQLVETPSGILSLSRSRKIKGG